MIYIHHERQKVINPKATISMNLTLLFVDCNAPE